MSFDILQPSISLPYVNHVPRDFELVLRSCTMKLGTNSASDVRPVSAFVPLEIITVELVKKESPITGKKRAYASDFILDSNACIYCELCVQVCPTDAIVMVKAAEEPGFHREDLVLTMERLYKNEKLRPLSWANATRLSDMQSPDGKTPKNDGEGG